MKKLAALTSTATVFLTSAASAFAQTNQLIQISRPNVGYSSIQAFINAGIRLIFVIALLAVLIMLIWGALQWIFSGGEKEAVGEARNRILHALIGLAVLAVAFALAALAGQFVGIDLFNLPIPNPNSPTPAFPSPSLQNPP
jgi:hypothetical protein